MVLEEHLGVARDGCESIQLPILRHRVLRVRELGAIDVALKQTLYI